MTFTEICGSIRRMEQAGNGTAELVGTMPWQVAENLVEGFLDCKKIILFFLFELFVPFFTTTLVIQKQLPGCFFK
ncbi:hypothetical protein VP02_05065 [Pseudomonas ogarae]|uniref:Uncharacterized protein n=1 Tax=Pseudomonas kilonensis TaxID=132476 RepID=A0A0F4XTJ2_9PSED|nr:hypothetical protein [Pseudomonas ogarae]KKA09151.1 hypothetical protein VP02_05065 [Pseudomonas ogarae]